MANTENRQDRAILALLECETIGEAAKKCGISRRTINNWLLDEDFLRRYRDTRNQMFNQALGRLCRLSNRAVTVMADAMNGKDITRVQLWAAKATLEHARDARMGDLEELQQRLERVLERFGGM